MTTPERNPSAWLESLGCAQLAALLGCFALVYAAGIVVVVWMVVAALRTAGVEL